MTVLISPARWECDLLVEKRIREREKKKMPEMQCIHMTGKRKKQTNITSTNEIRLCRVTRVNFGLSTCYITLHFLAFLFFLFQVLIFSIYIYICICVLLKTVLL